MAGDESEDMDVAAPPGVDDDGDGGRGGGSGVPAEATNPTVVKFGDAVHLDRRAADAAAGPLHGGASSSAAAAAAAAAPMSLDLPESSAAAVAKQAEALAEARARQRAALVAVPADDAAVRALLRHVLREPVTLFGERQYERRDRARKLLARMEPEEAAAAVAAVTEGGVAALVASGGATAMATEGGASPFFVPLRPEEAQTELFYTEGSEELVAARKKIALSSLRAASRRLLREREVWEARRRRRERAEAERRRKEDEDEGGGGGEGDAAADQGAVTKSNGAVVVDEGEGEEEEEEEEDPDAASDAVSRSARSSSALRLLCSELGDGRPLSALSFDHAPSPSSSTGSSATTTIGLAVGSWSGCASVWRADAASGALLPSSSWAVTKKGSSSSSSSSSAAAAAAAVSSSSRSWWRAHDDRVTGIAWRPFPRSSSSKNGSNPDDGFDSNSNKKIVDLATASADGTARLWSSSACALAAASAPAGAPCCPKPLAELKGHAARLARLAWHPGFYSNDDDGDDDENDDGNASVGSALLATASFDGSWRLWDAERAATIVAASSSDDSSSCLLEQEGHSRAVYCLSWHRDGALLASAGLDAHARVWDVRTGKTACVLSGHAKPILSVDFDPGATTGAATVATGAEDGCCRLWDLRSRGRPLATLPAHSSLVSTCRFLRSKKQGSANGSSSSSSPPPSASASVEGRLLLTAGYDGEAKVWDASDGRLLKTLEGHESRVMSADVAALYYPSSSSSSPPSNNDNNNDAKSKKKPAVPSLLVATSAYDRTLKLWGRLD